MDDVLQERETFLRLVTDSLPILIAYADVDERYQFVNKTAERWYERTTSEIIGRTIEDIFGETYDEVAPYVREALSGETVRYEKTLSHGDGNIREVDILYVPHFDEDGGVLGYFALAQDITERKRAEVALWQNEERLRSAFENAPIGNVVISETGRIEIFNSIAEEIFGYTRDEVVGRNVSLLMTEPDASRHDHYVWNYVKTGVAKIIGIGREVTGRRKNGEEFPMSIRVGEMPLGDERWFIGSVSDLTERKAMEAHLRQAQKMEAVGQLTGGLAHDFNNLLAIIQGNADLLAEEMGAGDPRMEAIIRASERGGELTQRLLAFSRLQPLRSRSIDLGNLTTGMSTLLKRTLGETIEITIDRSPDLWPVLADPGQVEIALLNLAINARDAMPAGGRLAIECTNTTLDEGFAAANPGAAAGDYAILAVSDTGEGMPNEVREHAFEPFFTTKEIGKGSGLGLSKFYGFAKQSGGYVSLRSEVGRGTTVRLYLPRAEEPPSAPEKESDGPAPSGRGELILVVEDDPDVRILALKMLERSGYRVIAVAEAESARSVLEREPVDLVLCDVILPGGVSGPMFVEAAQKHDPDIEAIFMSGYTAEAAKDDSLLASSKVLLNKPFSKAELAKALREALDH